MTTLSHSGPYIFVFINYFTIEINEKKNTHPIQRSGWLEEFLRRRERSPAIRQLNRVPTPGFQVQRRPGDIEQREQNVPDILGGLRAIVQHQPQEHTENGWHTERTGVVAQPGKVEANLDAEIFGNVVQRLDGEQLADPTLLEVRQRFAFVQREYLHDYAEFLPSSNCDVNTFEEKLSINNHYVRKWFCFNSSRFKIIYFILNRHILNSQKPHILPILCPSKTLAFPCNEDTSSSLARSEFNRCRTSHWRSWDVKNTSEPNSLVGAKQALSRSVNARSVPPRSSRRRFCRRASSAAWYNLKVVGKKTSKILSNCKINIVKNPVK